MPHLSIVREAEWIANGAQIYEAYGSPPGCSVVSTTLSERDMGSIRRRVSTGNNFQVLYVGYLRPWKGVEVLVRAFHRLKKALPGIRLVIVGAADKVDDSYQRQLLQQISELGLNDSVEMRGHLDFGPALFQTYADADVFVLPSLSGEGTPRVLVEARAFGCPVVATKVGGVESSLTDRVDGLIVAPNDPEAIATQVLAIAKDGELRERLVHNGQERVRQLTVEAFTSKMIHELEILLRSQVQA